MNFKFNWGTGAVLALLVMIIGMLILVSIAIKQNFDLVDTDYYQKSVNYQEHIDKVKRADELKEKVKVEIISSTITFQFPRISQFAVYSGKIHFYSPVDAKNDKIFDIKLDSAFMQSIRVNELKTGRYKIKVDWSDSESSYFFEEEISITN